MSSTEELSARVEQLEDRIAELERLLDDDPIEDIDMRMTSIEEDRIHPKEVINAIPSAREDGVEIEVVLQRLAAEGVDEPQEQVDKLRREGEIYEPRDGLVKVV